jgi:hypothetical protein
VPVALDEARFRAPEPGGATRAVIAGVRVLARADGTLETAADRLPASPTAVVRTPERLGGGFLYAIAKQLWRSDGWLSAARPIYTAGSGIGQILVGLDRVYLRIASGSLEAVDPRTGAHLDLGPLPASPHIGRLVARDGWRAIAVADLRGTLLTTDAGSSWRPLALPLAPTEVDVAGDGFVVGAVGTAGGDHQLRFWRVNPDGRVEALPAGTRVGNDADSVADPGATTREPARRLFGPRPLVAALEDGWPLEDGTALVARDGALARVRLSDGAIVELALDAFAPAPTRCHPVSLARPIDPAAFGFVCGETRGATRVFRWAAARGALEEIRRFDEPRRVLAFGNGALAAAGGCGALDDSRAASRSAPASVWCVMTPDGAWTERRVRGARAPEARLVVLSDGRLVAIWPPAGEGRQAHLEVVAADDAPAAAIPLAWPPLRADVIRAVSLGTWLDGFEERRPGVLGGWVDAAGSVVGVEASLDGQLRVGEYIRDAGSPVVSGRWAFGWTASRRGFETTDGGMTWSKDISLPDRVAESRAERAERTGGGKERACGPLGCIVAGWLRIGWGQAELPDVPAPPPPRPAGARPLLPPWHLRCQATDGPPREVATAPGTPRPPRPSVAGAPWGTVAEFPSFSGRAGPAMRAEDLGFTVEATYGFERALRTTPLARLYVWGPGTGDWDAGAGHWQVRWDWAWGGWRDARASASATSPWPTSDAARHALGIAPGGSAGWVVAPGDDADHALLLERRATTAGTPGTELVVLERDKPPLPVQRPGGDPFAEVESAIHASGHWYVATSEDSADAPATVVWEVDGGWARERARIPRAREGQTEARLARRSDGRALGLIVEGQPDAGQPAGVWVAGLDLESPAVSEPEPLASPAGRPPVPCTIDDTGWEYDTPFAGTVEVDLRGVWEAPLQTPMVHVRASRDRACVDRVAGAVGAFAAAAPTPLSQVAPAPAHLGPRTIDLSVFSARARYALRCASGPAPER